MSRKAEFLAKADECLALADRCGDWSSVAVLSQAAEAWRLLAELEDSLSLAPTPWGGAEQTPS